MPATSLVPLHPLHDYMQSHGTASVSYTHLYDIVLRYNNLTDTNKKTLRCLLKRLEQAQLEEGESDIAEEVLKNAEDSHMLSLIHI